MSLIDQWNESLQVLTFVRPQIDQVLAQSPGARVFIEYKTQGENFKYIPGLSEIYTKENMRVLAGIPTYKAYEVVINKLNDNKGFILGGIVIGIIGTLYARKYLKSHNIVKAITNITKPKKEE